MSNFEQKPEQKKIFIVGNRVIWDESNTTQTDVGSAWTLGVQTLIEKYGRGPFEITWTREGSSSVFMKSPDGRSIQTSPGWLKLADTENVENKE